MYKRLGRTEVSIPEIGLGTWNYHGGPIPLRRGLEAGALFIDTAEAYQVEPVIREAMTGMRERLFLATKVSPQNFRRADLHKSVETSLRRLGTDHLDLLQLHRPNPAIPIEETIGAMSELVDVGKTRFIGVCNFSLAELQAAQKALGSRRIVSNQVRYSVIDRTIENGLLSYCQTEGITVIAYSPLARSFDRILDCDPTGVIKDLAARLGKSPAQIVLNWCLCKDGVVIIPKGNSEAHVVDNCGASDWRLSAEQVGLLVSRIQYRHRTAFDAFARRFLTRGPLRVFALKAVKLLPRGVRRRLE